MVHVQAILCILCTVHKIFLMFLFVFCFRGCPNEALAQWLAKPEQNGRQAIHLVQVITIQGPKYKQSYFKIQVFGQLWPNMKFWQLRESRKPPELNFLKSSIISLKRFVYILSTVVMKEKCVKHVLSAKVSQLRISIQTLSCAKKYTGWPNYISFVSE